ncbi:unnamed protein product [Sphagnum troendelagicum]|uniref:Uncharacterized protein n=1 Tax=Sphagnum troendelagicum TaxID=128251 RepID=A0ABP0UNN9_9BRYO
MAVVAGSVLLSPFTSALAVVDSSSARDARGFSCYTASTASSAFFRGVRFRQLVSSLMTTEAMVADFPKEEKEMVGMGGMGVGGMGGMDY